MHERTLLLCLMFAPMAHGVSAPNPASPDTLLDEARIEASRARLTEMRQEMVRLEDLFYERYNALNANDDFDVHCAREARTGTRLERRYCRPVYESDLLATEGRDYYLDLLRCCDPGHAGPPAPPPQPPLPAVMMIEARKPDFRKTMLQVTRSNPELVRLLRERAEVAKRYEATRRKVFGRKPPPEDN